jgi:hypothetical protein
MSSKWRRFEILLPLQFNDGRDVPAEWLAEAVLEIVDHFGAASYETQNVYRKSILGFASKKALAGERIALVSPTLVST